MDRFDSIKTRLPRCENESMLSELVLREMDADSAASLASIAGKLGKSMRHVERIAPGCCVRRVAEVQNASGPTACLIRVE